MEIGKPIAQLHWVHASTSWTLESAGQANTWNTRHGVALGLYSQFVISAVAVLSTCVNVVRR